MFILDTQSVVNSDKPLHYFRVLLLFFLQLGTIHRISVSQCLKMKILYWMNSEHTKGKIIIIRCHVNFHQVNFKVALACFFCVMCACAFLSFNIFKHTFYRCCSIVHSTESLKICQGIFMRQYHTQCNMSLKARTVNARYTYI